MCNTHQHYLAATSLQPPQLKEDLIFKLSLGQQRNGHSNSEVQVQMHAASKHKHDVKGVNRVREEDGSRRKVRDKSEMLEKLIF
jgi:hypothetical protein